jgi:RNA polymerase sigma-B factor
MTRAVQGTRTEAVSLSVMTERGLFLAWQERRDPRAREELVRRYMPFTRKLALRYRRSSEPFDDLLQVASLALVKAIDRFEPDRGLAFKSFAVPTVLGELRRHFRDSSWSLHVSRGAQERALKVDQGRQQLTERNGRSPTVQDLAQFLEMDEESVVDAIQTQTAYSTASLDAPLRQDEDVDTVVDSLGEHDAGFARIEESSTVASVMGQLPAREQRILYLRFFEDRTQHEIADELGLSQMQISRLIRNSIERLRGLAAAAD